MIIATLLVAVLLVPGGLVRSAAVLCFDENGHIAYDVFGCMCAFEERSHEGATHDTNPALSSSLDEGECGTCVDIPLPTVEFAMAKKTTRLVSPSSTHTKSSDRAFSHPWAQANNHPLAISTAAFPRGNTVLKTLSTTALRI